MRIKYIRHNGHPIACIAQVDGNIGISFCNKNQKVFRKKRAREIAIGRAQINPVATCQTKDLAIKIPNRKIKPYKPVPPFTNVPSFKLSDVIATEVKRMQDNYLKFEVGVDN